MNLREYLRGHRNVWGMALMVLYCACEFRFAYSGARSCRGQDPQQFLGEAHVDLGQLQYRLTFADLQAAGMFAGIDCEDCDFSRAGYLQIVCDNEDLGFASLMSKRAQRLTLVFYGKDVSAGKRRFEQALQALRARFPGEATAFHLEYPWGEGERAQGSSP